MSPHTAALLLLTFWTSLQDGGGVSHRRTQRCACSTQMDSECHYFCHLDIIWINTPSKTTLYGLGSSASRRRRAAARCSCSRPADRTCAGFCDSSFKIQTEESVAKRPRPHLLSILRSLADGSQKLKDAEHLETQNAFDASETNVG